MRSKNQWIYEQPEWPVLKWDDARVNTLLLYVMRHLGYVEGIISHLPPETAGEILIVSLKDEICGSFEIEDESLDEQEVYSACCRLMGIRKRNLVLSSGQANAATALFGKAINPHSQELKAGDIKTNHRQLFSFGLKKPAFITGDWRKDDLLIMSQNREHIRLKAIAPDQIQSEIRHMIRWISENEQVHPLIKSAVIHLWFLIIHPFEDGNGHLSRYLSLSVAGTLNRETRLVIPVSKIIAANRSEYFDMLEHQQKGTTDISNWIIWYLNVYSEAISHMTKNLQHAMREFRLSSVAGKAGLTQRQWNMLRLLSEQEGSRGFNSSQWAEIAGVSQDSAYRDIIKLCHAGILSKSGSGGRSTRYHISGSLKKELLK